MLLATQQLDETDISGQVLKNLTECILLASAPSDSDRLVPDSSDKTSMQPTGRACYYHKKEFKSQAQTFYATNEELEAAITAARAKAANCKSNGEYFFCGSSLLFLKDDSNAIADVHSQFNAPVALIGRKIGLGTNCTSIPLMDDYSENMLFFGTNKQEQTVGELMNAMVSLMLSYRLAGTVCDFIVIDCLNKGNARYRELLLLLQKQGLCRIVPRLDSDNVLAAMVDAVKNGTAHPTVVSIIGNEHFAELKKDLSLPQIGSLEEPGGGFEPLGFDMGLDGTNSGTKTFKKALVYLLEEGPLCGVHFLLQVDKPENIMFNGEYGDNAVDKFKHKIIFRSENKCIVPLRLSKDIDVETLGEEEERLTQIGH